MSGDKRQARARAPRKNRQPGSWRETLSGSITIPISTVLLLFARTSALRNMHCGEQAPLSRYSEKELDEISDQLADLLAATVEGKE